MSVSFPKDFLFGAATSSYQIEGAYQQDGRGLSIWEEFCKIPGKIERGENGNIACDHYDRYKEDVGLMKEIGLQTYRFSIAWPRIFPNGRGEPNPKGVQFYHNLLDELEKANIIPYVTLFHWDLPLALEKEYGGFLSRKIIEDFKAYASFIFREFKGRIKHYVTINEPEVVSHLGYLIGNHAPGHKDMKEANVVAHHELLCHGEAVKVLRSIDPDAKIGIAPNYLYFTSAELTIKDNLAVQYANEYCNRWFTDPVFLGHYPEAISALYKKHNVLHDYDKKDLEIIKQPVDFLGINHYMVAHVTYKEGDTYLPWDGIHIDGDRTAMNWLIAPYSIYGCMMDTVKWYGNVPIFITENGMALHDTISTNGKVEDQKRAEFIKNYLIALSKSIQDGANVVGYYYWTFMDNFEWSCGYRPRFGLTYVDFETQKRTLKESAYVYRDIISSRGASLNQA